MQRLKAKNEFNHSFVNKEKGEKKIVNFFGFSFALINMLLPWFTDKNRLIGQTYIII